MKLKEKLAQDYAMNPKHCMEGWVPMGRTDDAFLAGFEKCRELAIAQRDDSKDPSELEQLGEEEVDGPK